MPKHMLVLGHGTQHHLGGKTVVGYPITQVISGNLHYRLPPGDSGCHQQPEGSLPSDASAHLDTVTRYPGCA